MGPEPLSAFELAVLRAVGHSDRPAIEITLRLLDHTPDLTLYGVAQWLLGAEVWRVLQTLATRGLVATRGAPPLLASLKPTDRKSYRLTLAGLDALAKSDVDDIMARVKEETPTEPPPAPDTEKELPPHGR